MPKHLRSLTFVLSPSLYPLFVAEQSFSLNLIADAYFANLAKIETGGIGKVQVALTNEQKQDWEVRDLVDVLVVHRTLDISAYPLLDPLQKKIIALRLFHEALLLVAKIRAWPTEPFETAMAATTAAGIEMHGQLGRAARSPDGSNRARLVYDYRRFVEVSFVVTDKNNAETLRLPIACLAGLEMLPKMFGQVKWESNELASIQYRNKADFWRVDLQTGSVDFVSERASQGDAHGQYQLGRMYSDGRVVPQDFTKAKLWFEKAASQGYAHARVALERLDITAVGDTQI